MIWTAHEVRDALAGLQRSAVSSLDLVLLGPASPHHFPTLGVVFGVIHGVDSFRSEASGSIWFHAKL